MVPKLKPIFHALAPLLRGEKQRQAAVDKVDVAETKQSAELKAIVEEVAEIFGTEMGIATLIDRQTQHILACHGGELESGPRDISFCGHTIARPDEIMCVFDATHDPRFAGNPLVLGTPHIRFYVGTPLISSEGEALGALCAIDSRPRMSLLPEQSKRLRALAEKAASILATAQG
ncbi:GAF domain-containing protein [Sphingomonas sp. HITSZ_GF]|uniref:GAF domain-containing protein n=1 Tax=Sphingomonas sp. HITSZ_GF TaxID=3037247 RepID=UPI00240D9B2A|nr:GAF domain-containing protein [Sphingomonas sp. HITSZ_GF]MDG2535153.1 GAF domain-containing protein [Sphingomonas sp. HITSZ_GF]